MSQNFTWPASSGGGGGGGDATAANQVLEIAQLTAINANTNGLETSLNEVSTNTLVLTQSLAADGAAAPAIATVIAGVTAGGVTQVLETNASGHLNIADGGGSITVDGPLTDAQLRATPVPVSGTVSTGGLTDTQLRATAVPVSLTSTTVTGSVAVTGPLTDTQLRATAVPVSLTSTTITGSVAVTGPLTDTQLRATAVPVSLTSTTVTNTVNAAAATPTALTVKQAAVTVGTTAVRATTDGSAPSATRSTLVITPDPASAATFYVGSSSVANSGSSRGVAIIAGQSIIMNSDAGDYYIIASVASQTVFIMEQE